MGCTMAGLIKRVQLNIDVSKIFSRIVSFLFFLWLCAITVWSLIPLVQNQVLGPDERAYIITSEGIVREGVKGFPLSQDLLALAEVVSPLRTAIVENGRVMSAGFPLWSWWLSPGIALGWPAFMALFPWYLAFALAWKYKKFSWGGIPSLALVIMIPAVAALGFRPLYGQNFTIIGLLMCAWYASHLLRTSAWYWSLLSVIPVAISILIRPSEAPWILLFTCAYLIAYRHTKWPYYARLSLLLGCCGVALAILPYAIGFYTPPHALSTGRQLQLWDFILPFGFHIENILKNIALHVIVLSLYYVFLISSFFDASHVTLKKRSIILIIGGILWPLLYYASWLVPDNWMEKVGPASSYIRYTMATAWGMWLLLHMCTEKIIFSLRTMVIGMSAIFWSLFLVVIPEPHGFGFSSWYGTLESQEKKIHKVQNYIGAASRAVIFSAIGDKWLFPYFDVFQTPRSQSRNTTQELPLISWDELRERTPYYRTIWWYDFCGAETLKENTLQSPLSWETTWISEDKKECLFKMK